jgi:hypothetical protein
LRVPPDDLNLPKFDAAREENLPGKAPTVFAATFFAAV